MNYAWIHIASVHLPIALAVLSALLVLVALATRSPVRLRVALELTVLGALLTWPTYLTGESADHRLDDQPGIEDVDMHYYIHEHEEMAEKALIAFQVAGGLALLGWLVFRKAEKFNLPLAIVMLLATGTAAGLMAWTGHRGGNIRHTEVRNLSPADSTRAPVRAGAERSADDDDEEDH